MNEDTPKEPKIIIDEDWKTQVQREKERLKKQKESPSDEDESGSVHPAEMEAASFLSGQKIAIP